MTSPHRGGYRKGPQHCLIALLSRWRKRSRISLVVCYRYEEAFHARSDRTCREKNRKKNLLTQTIGKRFSSKTPSFKETVSFPHPFPLCNRAGRVSQHLQHPMGNRIATGGEKHSNDWQGTAFLCYCVTSVWYRYVCILFAT